MAAGGVEGAGEIYPLQALYVQACVSAVIEEMSWLTQRSIKTCKNLSRHGVGAWKPPGNRRRRRFSIVAL